MANFRVGQRVTPKRSGSWRALLSRRIFAEGEEAPMFGRIYTIIEIATTTFGTVLRFPEFQQRFDAEEFRPVVERKTDISIFTKMLNPQTKKVRA